VLSKTVQIPYSLGLIHNFNVLSLSALTKWLIHHFKKSKLTEKLCCFTNTNGNQTEILKVYNYSHDAFSMSCSGIILLNYGQVVHLDLEKNWRCHFGVVLFNENWLQNLISDIVNQDWASECPDVKDYKWRRNPVWHRMPYSCTRMATVSFKGLIIRGIFPYRVFWTFPAVVNSLAIGIDSNILCLFGTVYLSSAITLVTLKKYTGLVQNSTLWFTIHIDSLI